MRIPKNSRKPYTVFDDNDTPALVRCYAYLWRQNPLWLCNTPGYDNKALRAEYRARRADLVELIRWDDAPPALRAA